MSEVEVTRSEGAQVIRVTRAGKRNALTGAMYAAITEALGEGDRNLAVVAHVLLGSDGVFSAGNDIADFLATARGADGLVAEVVRFVRALPTVAKPIIAGVDGPAIGIGTTLLLHCDLVYATPGASFATPFLDLALVPEAGSSLLMPARMGYARAFEMLVLGEIFGPERAREAGLVNAIVPTAELEETVLAAAHRLAAKPPEALAAARRLMRGDPSAIIACIDAETSAFRERLASAEAVEAFEAFLEKRPPRFGNRSA
jgi:enoyl-CoA hydratase/carnithine racemase